MAASLHNGWAYNDSSGRPPSSGQTPFKYRRLAVQYAHLAGYARYTSSAVLRDMGLHSELQDFACTVTSGSHYSNPFELTADACDVGIGYFMRADQLLTCASNLLAQGATMVLVNRSCLR